MTPTALTRTDAALMSAARTDPDAFRELYGRYDERVHGYFVRRTRDDAAALDLTAETFAQAWLVRARFRDEAGGSAAPWLFGIARNALLMSVRRGAIERRATERLGLMGRLDHAPAGAAARSTRRGRTGAATSARRRCAGRSSAPGSWASTRPHRASAEPGAGADPAGSAGRVRACRRST